MPIDVILKNGKGIAHKAKITSRGQQVTGPLGFTKMHEVEAITINTAFNIVPPITGKQFVITIIDLYADKNVGPNDATVEMYEANSIDDTTVLETVYKKQMPKNRDIGLPGLNIIISEGVWLNIKTDDNIIFANIGGYYVDAE